MQELDSGESGHTDRQTDDDNTRLAQTGKCGSTLWADWKEGLSERDMADVERFKGMIIDAIRSKDLSKLPATGRRSGQQGTNS